MHGKTTRWPRPLIAQRVVGAVEEVANEIRKKLRLSENSFKMLFKIKIDFSLCGSSASAERSRTAPTVDQYASQRRPAKHRYVHSQHGCEQQYLLKAQNILRNKVTHIHKRQRLARSRWWPMSYNNILVT